MDTGADCRPVTSESLTRGGDDWVRLSGGKDASDKVYEHKVSRISKIKSRADEEEDKDEAIAAKRPVIDLEMPG